MYTAVKLDTRIKDIEVTDDSIIAHLMDGRTISVPLVWSWRLTEATPTERKTTKSLGTVTESTGLILTKTSARKG